MLRRTVLLAGVFSLMGGFLLAQVPPEERIPVTDPDRLEKMGFPRDAKNVYVWSKADLKGGTVEKAVAAPETWGPATGYSSVFGSELQQEYDYVTLARTLNYGAFCYGNDDAGENFTADAWAQIQVPEGAKLGSFQFWAYDAADPEDLVFSVYETCQPGTGPPTNTLIGATQTILAIGDYTGFTPLNGLAVNNRDCVYVVRVRFASYPDACVGSFLAVRKLRFTWTRQVSPAPATASFNDVPTTDGAFQFIEALVKSGITVGCGGGNYCPDAPLTRRQMAVFLAKGLGLQWP